MIVCKGKDIQVYFFFQLIDSIQYSDEKKSLGKENCFELFTYYERRYMSLNLIVKLTSVIKVRLH